MELRFESLSVMLSVKIVSIPINAWQMSNEIPQLPRIKKLLYVLYYIFQ